MRLFTHRFLTIILLFISTCAHAQESARSAYQWKVTANKLAADKYELLFSSPGAAGTQLYAPSQDLGGTPSAELSFNDSTIAVESFTATTNIKQVTSAIFDNKKLNITEGTAAWKAVIHFKNAVPALLLGKLSVYFNRGEEFVPDIPFEFSTALEGGMASTSKIKIASIDVKHPVNDCGDNSTENESLLTLFFLGFLGGLIALITPCVFPMIPVTVTFFTKKSLHRKRGITNGIIYGLCIFLIYVAITIPFHLISGISPEIFNNISTNVWLNLIFFIVFVFFAFSFFGLYEIGLPSGLANKADSKSGLGNIFGIFFMAGTLAIVSFSCTGPILGTLLANEASAGPWPLTAGAAGFGIALGLPFALFAMFPGWLGSLPKSGSWMTNVKVVLGFVELALAVKFLANADNVEQWGFLKREVFVALWIIIGVLTVLYILGIIKIGYNKIQRFKPVRIGFIILFASFTIYLVPGVTNTKYAGLKLISGFPPPLSYSIYKHHVLLAKRIEPLKNDYEKALALAKAEGRPLLIDFTGWACTNCRRMEELVWTDKEVDSLMRTKFVVVSLYVDEKTKLPAAEQTVFKTSEGKDKQILTVGDKWATFQNENFDAVAQPQYAIISGDEKALTRTKFYTPNPVDFAKWLKCGIEASEKKK